MTAIFLIILIVACAALIGGALLRKSHPDADKEDGQYYTEDGYHIYYDRKMLRRLREEQEKQTKAEETPQAQQEM